MNHLGQEDIRGHARGQIDHTSPWIMFVTIELRITINNDCLQIQNITHNYTMEVAGKHDLFKN